MLLLIHIYVPEIECNSNDICVYVALCMKEICPMMTKTTLMRLMYGALALVGLLTVFALFGPETQSAKADSPSFVRIIHASPDVGTADVFVDGSKLLSSFAFGTVTNYVAIPAGPHLVQIALVGKGVNGAALTQTLSVSPGVAYTVAALGTQATGVSLQVFIDNNQFAPGMAKLRIYHLAPDLGSVSVTNGSNVNVGSLSYPQVSDYLSVAPGTYNFTVSSAQNGGSYPLTATLSANMVTSIFAVGLLNGTPKFTFTTAQVNGLPGLPGTGSDPNAVTTPTPAHSTSLPIPWLFDGIALLLVATIGIRLFFTSRGNTSVK